jgi:hypothetical protein
MKQLVVEKNVMWSYELGEHIGEFIRNSFKKVFGFLAVYGLSIIIGIFAILIGALLGKKKKENV